MTVAEWGRDYWDTQTHTLEQAKECVWAVEPGRYDDTTTVCLDILYSHVPRRASTFLDVGAGCGRLSIPFAVRYPSSRIYAFDISAGMLRLAQEEAEQQGVNNMVTVHGDKEVLAGLPPIDFAYSIVVLQHNPPEVCAPLVKAVGKVMSSGGVFVYQTISDRDFSDWGHLAEEVTSGWAIDAGLEVVETFEGGLSEDWHWTVARRGFRGA